MGRYYFDLEYMNEFYCGCLSYDDSIFCVKDFNDRLF